MCVTCGCRGVPGWLGCRLVHGACSAGARNLCGRASSARQYYLARDRVRRGAGRALGFGARGIGGRGRGGRNGRCGRNGPLDGVRRTAGKNRRSACWRSPAVSLSMPPSQRRIFRGAWAESQSGVAAAAVQKGRRTSTSVVSLMLTLRDEHGTRPKPAFDRLALTCGELGHATHPGEVIASPPRPPAFGGRNEVGHPAPTSRRGGAPGPHPALSRGERGCGQETPWGETSRKPSSLRARTGCCSLRMALASTWRTRSRVTLKILPTSSSV
jgi:hypothetical protein